MERVHSDEQRYLEPTLPGQFLQVIGFLCCHHVEERPYQSLTGHLPYILKRVSRIIALGMAVFQLLFGEGLLCVEHVGDAHILAHLPHFLLKSHATHQVGHTLFYGKVTVGVVHDLFRTRPGDKP